MNKIIVLFTSLLLMGWSLDAAAFSCQVPDTGQTMDSGSANIYVNLAPSIGVGQNLVVDLSSSIVCRNDDGSESNNLLTTLISPAVLHSVGHWQRLPVAFIGIQIVTHYR
jgi:minor fimbrial subunit